MIVKNILQEIVNNKKEEIERQKKFLPLSEIKANLENSPPVRSIERKFQECIVTGRMLLIAEVKKASPSKGVIKKDFNPVEIAKIYERCGASAISILTDEKYFQGSLEYLKQIREVVSVPVLRKDFIIDPYQVYQSKYYGADFILLISSILPSSELNDLEELTTSLGMSCLIETHSEEEFDFHLNRKTKIIGINNRDLTNFKTDISHTLNLIKNKKICKCYIVSESGIKTYEDVLKLSNSNINGILVGESFMKEDDIETAIGTLMKNNL